MLRFLTILGLLCLPVRAEEAPAPAALSINEIKRDKPVDFATEIIPIFQKNCLPCHNATDAKGDLVMETPASILKGGESGPAAVPGKGTESLLLKAAAHQTKPSMPPKNNKADAKPLTPGELGLLKLWIDQGATGQVATLPPIHWQSLAEGFNPIQAVAITPDGQFAACGRGNQIDLYELPTGRFVGSLIDPDLKGADRDLIESLAFSPDGTTLAAGSYRRVRLWKKMEPDWGKVDSNSETNVFGTSAVSADGTRKAEIVESGSVKLMESGGKVVAELKGDRLALQGAAREQRLVNFARSETAFRKKNLETAEKQQKAEAEALKKVTDAKAGADKTLAEKMEASKKAAESKMAAEKVLSDTTAAIGQATENKNLSQKLTESAEAAAKGAATSAEEAAKVLARAQADRETAYGDIVALAKADKTAEANGAIDRALVIKLSFEHAQSAKSVADKASAEAAANTKAAQENKGKAEKTLADLTTRQKDADGKVKAAEKQLADADAAAKKAETAVKNAETNLKSTADVAKKADEEVASSKGLLADTEKAEKEAVSALEAANKRASETEKKPRGLAFAGPWLVAQVDDTLRFYAAESGRPGPVRTIDGTAQAANAESIFAATGESNLVSQPISPVWKLERQIGDGSEKSPLADRVLTVNFSGDGKLLVTGGGVPSRSGELKIWKTADGTLAREIKDAHSDTVFSARFSPDQKYIASGAADKLMKVFEAASGKFVRSFEGHTHHVLNVSWMRHGRTLASAGADSTIKIWDFASGEQKKSIAGVTREITAFQFLDGINEALAASGDNQLRLLRDDGANVRSYSGASDYTQAAAITPDGKWLVAGGNDSQFRLWDGAKGDLLKTFPPPPRGQKSALANATSP